MTGNLDRRSPVPLYHQVRSHVLRQIETGRWRPGERIPTEDELSAQLAVSKITVRNALRELTALGYIRREQGRGTFVQRPRLEEGPSALTGFSDEMGRHGLVAASQVLEGGPLPATPEVAEILGVAAGEALFRLRRLRLADGEPMGIQTAFLPLALVPGIAEIDFAGASLYRLLRERYGLAPARARETYTAVLVGAAEARLLRQPAGAPAMAAERIAVLADGRPLEYVQSIMRGDRYKVVLELASPPAAR